MEKILQDLKTFLDFLPDGFTDKPKIDFNKEKISEEEKKEIIEFGKRAFPYVYAYTKVFDDCCRIKEEAGIHNYIKDANVRKSFDKYIREGGEVEQIRQGKVDEDYLSEDDIKMFMDAEREVHKEVHREVQERIEGQDKEKFGQYVEEGKTKVDRVDAGISNLRQIAGEAPEYSEEIFEKIEEINARWVNYKNEPQEEDLNELLSYYSSVLGE